MIRGEREKNENIPSATSENPDNASPNAPTYVIPILFAIDQAYVWRSTHGITMRVRRIKLHPCFTLSRKSTRKLVANVSQKPKMRSMPIAQKRLT